jgi:two-component system, chemotaxis family, chemotaxis protein CheY
MPRPTTALIVDDEAHVRAFLRLVLKELGIETVWEADDGAKGLAALAEHKPQLMLLDVNMPVMNGLEVLEQAMRSHPETAVVVITSQSAIQTVHSAHRLGAAAYLLKHSPRADALKTLREVLDGLEEEQPENQADERA